MHPLLITLAVLPGLAWLLFFLRKDAHPESNRMILKVFFWGALSAIPAVLVEFGFFELSLPTLINIFVGVALVEEGLKYAVVKIRVFSFSVRELDEPLDIMLYMVIAALGFATIENLLIFLSPSVLDLRFEETLVLSGFRFISATFLHALASGTLGLFMALGECETKKRKFLFWTGFSIAVLLHGLYNWAIMTQEDYLKLFFPVAIIAILAVLVSWGFRKLKKMPNVCMFKL